MSLQDVNTRGQELCHLRILPTTGTNESFSSMYRKKIWWSREGDQQFSFCLEMKGFPGFGSFGPKTRRVLGKLAWVGHSRSRENRPTKDHPLYAPTSLVTLAVPDCCFGLLGGEENWRGRGGSKVKRRQASGKWIKRGKYSIDCSPVELWKWA